MLLDIRDLHVSIDGKSVLKGVNLKVNAGEIHVFMGPNGAGKSSLAKFLSGDPSYEFVQGQVQLAGQDLLEMEVEERAHAGLFVGFQYPVEIPGVTNRQFLKASLDAQRKAQKQEALSEQDFEKLLLEKAELVQMKVEFLDRFVNDGFSGGEKKRNEILQMALLDPLVTILDETDSGLDIDAMRIIAHGVNQMHNSSKGLVLITHYTRLLEYITPDFVHVIADGKITTTGGMELAQKLEEVGYDPVIAGS